MPQAQGKAGLFSAFYLPIVYFICCCWKPNVVDDTHEEPYGASGLGLDNANNLTKPDTAIETSSEVPPTDTAPKEELVHPEPSPELPPSSQPDIAEPEDAQLTALEAIANEELPLRKIICNVSLQALGGVLLDMALTSTPCKYRMIDCSELVDNQRLRIYEYTDLPPTPYSAISYVWRGLSTKSSRAKLEYGLFNVCGAEDGDPINIDLLIEVGKLSMREGSGLVWLDRLCVLQTSREDKAWQIMRMHGVYQSCHICLIIPGGLSRLADLCEQTAWIERAWTLQEAMVPRRTLVLFAWKFGSGSLQDVEDVPENIFELTSRKSATAELSELLEICTEESFLTFYGSGNIWRRVWPALFDPGPARVLQMAMAKRASEWTQSAVWRCAHMRVSSRPVDMIFSIMGMFGVSLDPKKFHPDDRLHATVALMQAILRNGGKASWMGAISGTNPCKQLSSFMVIPPLGDRYLEDTSLDFEVLPVDLKGVMDDDGYFQFSAKAAPVVSNLSLGRSAFPAANEVPSKDAEGRIFFFVRSSGWSIPLEAQGDHKMFMVLFGRGVLSFDDPDDDQDYVVMLIEKHAPGLFHQSYTMLSVLGEGWQEVIDGWEEQTFKLGGPEELGSRIKLEERKKVVPSTSPGPASGNMARKAMLLGAGPTATQGIGDKLPILVEEQEARPDAWEGLVSSVWYNYLNTVSDPWNVDSSQLLPELQTIVGLCFPHTREVVSLDSDIYSLAVQKISEWRKGFVLAALDVLDASLEEERKWSEMSMEEPDDSDELPTPLRELFSAREEEKKTSGTYIEEPDFEPPTPHDDAEYVRQKLGGDFSESQPFLWGSYRHVGETSVAAHSAQFASPLITETFASHLFLTPPCPIAAEMETNPRAALAMSAIAVEYSLSFWDSNAHSQEDKLKKVEMYFNEARWGAKTHSHLEAIARLSEDEWDQIHSSVNRALSSKRINAEHESIVGRSRQST
ncbi:hypothetical protein D9615_006934 [Tricholomella constricta]|uniref:Heterokaryon incompatibility domain-containing protein n=1 Tax=Tricholomella constricta TaxID=117010 RepID=A0A8H5H891_9AGAR|nr:hypothetical protein D9615_006934 [Tricholomella constricta]